MIRQSVANKAKIVSADEREAGIRALLNFGHSFAHALETLTAYSRFLHGEAVAIGMVMAANFAVADDELSAEAAQRQRQLLIALGLPTSISGIDPDEIVALMARDKKADRGELRLVIPRAIGQVEVRPVTDRARLRPTCGGPRSR